MSDFGRRLAYAREDKSISPHETLEWFCGWRVDKYDGINFADPAKRKLLDLGLITPDDYVEGEGNALMQAGGNQLFTGLASGLSGSSLWSTSFAALAVGDSNTANSGSPPTYTDLQAAAGSAIQTSGFASVTNATPIVVTNGSGNWTVTPAVGSCVVVSGITTETAADGTFEVSASTATTVTLLNSVGNGVAGSLASGVMKQINRYVQQANGAGSAVITNNQIVYVAVFASTNANHAWNEWSLFQNTSGYGVNINSQAAPPSKMLNRAVASMGTKASGASWTLTVTLSLT